VQHKQSLKDKLIKGGAWAFGGKLVTALSALAVNALLARMLDPAEMGAYFLVFSVVSVMAMLGQLGLAQVALRFVAESMGVGNPSAARRVVLQTMRMVMLGLVVLAGLLLYKGSVWVAMGLFGSEPMAQVMGLIAAWVFVFGLQQWVAEVFRGFHDIRMATVFGGLLAGLLSAIAFFGLWQLQGHSDLQQAVLLSVLAGVVSVAISSLVLWRRLSSMESSPGSESGNALSLLGIGWPLLVSNLTFFVITQVDLWVMGMFRPADEVAVYGAAVKTVSLVLMPLLIANAVVPPLISEMFARDELSRLESALRKVATLAGLPALLSLVVFLFFGDQVLVLLFGEFYKAGGVVLIILSLGQMVNVWAGSCGLAMALTGHQLYLMAISLFCGVITVSMACLLVEDYGGVGVAIATATGVGLQNVMMLLMTKRVLGIWTHVSWRSLYDTVAGLRR